MSGNEARSAECPEFASIVIELVIGNYYPLQTITYMPLVSELQTTAVVVK